MRSRCGRAPCATATPTCSTAAKTFITGAGDADLYIVMARTGEGTHGVSAFLVESAWPGVSAGTPLAKMGLHGSWTGELVLDGVRVPAANRLGDEGVGFTVAMSALDSGRVGISAQAVGIAQGALDAAVDVVAPPPRRGSGGRRRRRWPTWRCAPPPPAS